MLPTLVCVLTLGVRSLFLAGLVLFALAGCVPAVVLVDRPSVIEEESAGEWIDIEEELSLLNPRLSPILQQRDGAEAAAPASRLLPTGQLPSEGPERP